MPHAEASDIRVPSDGGRFFINSVHYGNFEFPHVFCLSCTLTDSELQ